MVIEMGKKAVEGVQWAHVADAAVPDPTTPDPTRSVAFPMVTVRYYLALLTDHSLISGTPHLAVADIGGSPHFFNRPLEVM